jgi:hypothetical protein
VSTLTANQSYVFQIAVTDTVGTTYYTVKDGAVSVNSSGIVVTGASTAINNLIGPQVPWGQNTWPWLDDRHKKFADVLINYDANLDNSGNAYPGIDQSGTVTVTNGSNVLLGSGTGFKVLFCAGGTTATTLRNPIIWTSPKTPVTVSSCADDTHLIMSSIWGGSNASGLTFSINNTIYSPYWDTPQTGTVSVTTGSATLTGVGTGFKALFCAGGIVAQGVHPIIWWPVGDGTFGRRQVDVSACTDDTHLTMGEAWSIAPQGSGLQFSVNDYTSWWDNAGFPGQFYDSDVLLYYTLWYSSGIDDYLVAARAGADKLYRSPIFDQGNACNINQEANCFHSNRIYFSALGLVVRALDGMPQYWNGLHVLWGLDDFDSTYFFRSPGYIYDGRQAGWLTRELSYCALYDPDSVWTATCHSDLISMLEGTAGYTAALQVDGGMYGLIVGRDGTSSSWYTSGATTAVMTNGSSTAGATGSPWSSGMFTDCTGQGVIGCPIWFTNSPSATPLPAGSGDPQVYYATYIDANHVLLHDVSGSVITYQGTTGTHGWASGDSSSVSFVGPGSQPYGIGILAASFMLASQALLSTSPANAALYSNYGIGLANWLRTKAWQSSSKSMYYWVGLAECTAPIPDNTPPCSVDPTNVNNVSGQRFYNGQSSAGLIAAFRYSRDATLGAFTDAVFSAMFSKPGTGGPSPDGNYITGLDDAGFYLSTVVSQTNKAAGELLGGVGLQPSWSGVRIPLVPSHGTSIVGAYVVGGIR